MKSPVLSLDEINRRIKLVTASLTKREFLLDVYHDRDAVIINELKLQCMQLDDELLELMTLENEFFLAASKQVEV